MSEHHQAQTANGRLTQHDVAFAELLVQIRQLQQHLTATTTNITKPSDTS